MSKKICQKSKKLFFSFVIHAIKQYFYNRYFRLRLFFCIRKPLKRKFKPVFLVQNHPWNLYCEFTKVI